MGSLCAVRAGGGGASEGGTDEDRIRAGDADGNGVGECGSARTPGVTVAITTRLPPPCGAAPKGHPGHSVRPN